MRLYYYDLKTSCTNVAAVKKCVCSLTGLHSDRISHWLQIFSWHADLVTGLSVSPHSSDATVTEVSVALAWTCVTWRQMTWRCWVPGPHFLLHSDHSPTSQLSANHRGPRAGWRIIKKVTTKDVVTCFGVVHVLLLHFNHSYCMWLVQLVYTGN